jgi:hypothetical protein
MLVFTYWQLLLLIYLMILWNSVQTNLKNTKNIWQLHADKSKYQKMEEMQFADLNKSEILCSCLKCTPLQKLKNLCKI